MEETSLEEVTDAELIEAFLDARQTDLHVAMPCKVESYDREKGTVDVVPALNRSLPDGAGNYVSRPRPKLTGVPVKWQRTKQFAVTIPIQAGDFGLLVVCERNIAAWRATGVQGDPGDLGMHTLDGAVFLPGLYPDDSPAQSADGTNMVIGSDTDGDSRIEIKPTGGMNLGAGASKGVARQDDTVDLGTFTITGSGVSAQWVPPGGGPPVDLTAGADITGKISSSSSKIKAVD